MSTNGWEFDLTHDGSIQTDTYKSIDEKCGTISKWYGWSSHSFVGTLSAILNGTGKVTLDFGNCWDDGKVKVYLDSKLMAVAGEDDHSVTKTFSFSPGSLLEIKDEDGNAVILLNSIKFACNGKIDLINVSHYSDFHNSCVVENSGSIIFEYHFSKRKRRQRRYNWNVKL